MKTRITGGALALLATMGAQTAHAQGESIEANEITVESPLLQPLAGLMNDHMHEGGEVMIGVRFERQRYGGANRGGTEELADAEVLAVGYGVRAQSMEMDMVMLDLMFAPTDNLTLMAMPHYMWHRMEMVGVDPMAGMGGGHGGHHRGHSLPYGEVHSHGAEGFGDTLISASYRLARGSGLNAHATLGVWVPTGAVGLKNTDGTFAHYGMQPGSGTWDIEPSFTLGGRLGGGASTAGWGAQASYRWRTSDENDSGFAFGDKAKLTGWLSYLFTGNLGGVARLEYEHEGPVDGHYNGPHNHSAPPDLQGNYGGDTVSAVLGLNWLLPVGGRVPRLSAELGVPIYQDVNGIQLPRDWRFSLGISQIF
jgi:hypothetical protein